MTRHLAIDEVEAVAAAQHGVFAERQARMCNVSDQMLWHHSRPGRRWRRVAARVYEVVEQPADWRRPLMAAALSLEAGGTISHRSSALLHGLDGVRNGPPEMIVARGHTNPEWRVHRRDAVPFDLDVTAGIPHTNAERTVRDLCSVLDDDHMEMALESVLRLGLVTLEELGALARLPRWKGVRRLRAVLERRPPGAPPTGSELETRFVQRMRAAGVRDPVRQHPVYLHGELVAVLDVSWPDAAVFVELHGGVHEELAALRRDRQRQNDVVRILGWRPLIFTWTDVVDRPHTMLRVVRHALLPPASSFRA